MDAADLKRVQFLVRPAAWAYHQGLPEGQRADLDLALAEFGDVRLVAGYVLDVACEAARKAAAQASVGQLKRLKDGSSELEYFQGSSDLAADAEGWCALAQALRDEVAREAQAAFDRPSSVALDIRTGF